MYRSIDPFKAIAPTQAERARLITSMADVLSRAASLAGVMEEAGPACSASEASLAAIMNKLPAPTEQAVAEVLCMIARTSKGIETGSSAAWNVDVIVDALKAANPAIDWRHVADHLDQPSFIIPDAAALQTLMAAWHHATTDPFPIASLSGRAWNNATGQLSFIQAATAAPCEVFPWDHCEGRQAPLEGLHAGKPAIGTPNGCWLCLSVYNVLATLADSGHATAVRQILEVPLKTCPEIALLGVASVKGGWGPLQTELCEAPATTYIAPHPNSSLVLTRLWPLNKDIVMRAMVVLHSKDASTIARVLDVCQELKALTDVLRGTPTPFCTELAALAARREYLNLEKWLGEQFESRGVGFMQETVAFLADKLKDDPIHPVAASNGGKINISVDTLAIFLRALALSADLLPSDTLQQFKVVQGAAIAANPTLQQMLGDLATLEAFASDIEEEANAYFQKIYSGEMKVDHIVTILKDFKNSTVGREQEVFACMIHNLFDEYRFFPKYPDKELFTTAVLFGQLVHHGLVSSITLGIALRYVLEALKTPPGDKLHTFAASAAEQFVNDLHQWPQICAQILAIPNIKDSDTALYKAAEKGMAESKEKGKTEAEKAAAAALVSAKATEAFNLAGAPALQPKVESNAAGFPSVPIPSTPSNPNMLFSTINAETLEQAAQNVSFPVPDDRMIDKVHFLVNNLALTNIEAKVRELRELVQSVHYLWFSNYMVVKRAAQEPNFHPTYAALVEKWDDRTLRDNFVNSTVHYCKIMLGSKLLKNNSSERTLLKNLGAFLGRITLAKNRPVLQRDLDVKATIINAYEEGKMLAVLSFIRQLLDPAMDSKVFRPPNPWVMAICALLAEIYNLDNLKTGLKFEVELLFKSLGMSIADVEPSSLLVGRQREMADNMDFQAPRPIPGATTKSIDATPADSSKPTTPAAATPVIDPNIIANLHQFIVINPQLAAVQERLGIRRVLPMAIDRAIVEIISPVVERSVTIACMTAQELVTKDYATEQQPEVIRKAAHLAVTGLAQSLALVTAKEPLRVAIANNLRALLANPQMDSSAIEQVVGLLVSDNLDLCCQVVEKATGDRAQREIDERLTPAYAARARAKAAGQQFVDASQLSGRFPAALPDSLRARPGALTPQQVRVYEDFARIPRTAAAAQQGMGVEEATGGQEEGQPGMAPLADLRTRFFSWLQRLDLAISKEPQATLASLAEGHEVRTLANEVANVPTNEATALEVAKTLFTRLYQGAASRLHITAYAAALEALGERALPRLPSELTVWFASLADEVKFRKDVCEVLVRSRLFVLPDLDLYLTKCLASHRYQPPADMLVHLLQSCIIPDPAVLSVNELPHSLTALAKLAARFSEGHSALALIEEARRVSLLRSGLKPGGPAVAAVDIPKDPPALVETVMKLFDRWARLLEEMPSERQHSAFVQELHAAGLLATEEMRERYVRIMIQLAVQHCLRSETVQSVAASAGAGGVRGSQLSFIAVDAFVKLMVCLVTQHGGGVPLLSKILGTLATALLRDADERGTAFNGRPYYRMIIGFMSELTPADVDKEDPNVAYLQAIAAFLYATRALRVPQFAFPWLQLVSDKRFMPRMIAGASQVGWPSYFQLLLAQLRFLEPFLRNAELNDTLRLLYRGTVKLMLLLLHDVPEFLCHFYLQLIEVIPPAAVQLRNMALSGFPRRMRLPDPFTPTLKVDMLPEIIEKPSVAPSPQLLLPEAVVEELDALLGTRLTASAVVASILNKMILRGDEAVARGTRYNVALLNNMVFYLASVSLEQNPPELGCPPMMAGLPATALIMGLLKELESEGRYLLINALVNQLRYPQAFTHWFSCLLLHCFHEADDDEIIQEQITRVLLERLVVNRPHPWGLIITFIELIKNPQYNFWSHSFTRVAPEIERLFEGVARSCLRAPGAGGSKDGVPATSVA